MHDIRTVLAGDEACLAASVFSPVSVAMAADLGFRCAVVGGSVIAASRIAAPDYGLLTMTELVDAVRQICTGSRIPVIVDGDSGYGNALNSWRLVRELEAAGAAAVTLEDYVLPRPFAAGSTLSACEEHCDKLVAALEARQDSRFAVIARTRYDADEGLDACLARVCAYASTGVDAICIFGFCPEPVAQALVAACSKPLMIIAYRAQLSDLPGWGRAGVRVVLNGHRAFEESLLGMYRGYASVLSQTECSTPADIVRQYTGIASMEALAERFVR